MTSFGGINLDPTAEPAFGKPAADRASRKPSVIALSGLSIEADTIFKSLLVPPARNCSGRSFHSSSIPGTTASFGMGIGYSISQLAVFKIPERAYAKSFASVSSGIYQNTAFPAGFPFIRASKSLRCRSSRLGVWCRRNSSTLSSASAARAFSFAAFSSDLAIRSPATRLNSSNAVALLADTIPDRYQARQPETAANAVSQTADNPKKLAEDSMNFGDIRFWTAPFAAPAFLSCATFVTAASIRNRQNRICNSKLPTSLRQPPISSRRVSSYRLPSTAYAESWSFPRRPQIVAAESPRAQTDTSDAFDQRLSAILRDEHQSRSDIGLASEPIPPGHACNFNNNRHPNTFILALARFGIEILNEIS